jgi:hypothetical protein
MNLPFFGLKDVFHKYIVMGGEKVSRKNFPFILVNKTYTLTNKKSPFVRDYIAKRYPVSAQRDFF